MKCNIHQSKSDGNSDTSLFCFSFLNSNETYIQETSEPTYIQNDTTNAMNNSTTQFPEETTEQKFIEYDPTSDMNVLLLVILLFCFVLCVVCVVGVCYRKGKFNYD